MAPKSYRRSLLKPLKIVLAFLPLMALTFLAMELMTRHTIDHSENRQRLILCAVSALCNLPVLFVHWCFPPHPKYLIQRRKKFSIRVHVICGTIEFAAAVAAWLTLVFSDVKNPIFATSGGQGFAICATVMACAALLGHIPSAAYQTRIVFGTRAIMLPSYILCIALHGYCAVKLLLEPTSTFWLYNTFLAFNIYAWVRVFYLAFCKLKLLEGSRYTVAVLCAGAMMGPSVLGPAAILFLFAFICAFDVLYWLVFRKTHDLGLFMRERRRNTYHSEELRQVWARLKLEALKIDAEDLSDKEQAKKVFDTLDTDDSELLSAEEIEKLLVDWKVSEKLRVALVAYLTKKNGVDFERFYRHMWCFGNTEWLQQQSVHKFESQEQKARFVFDLIDLDNSGCIDPLELQTLLFAWGLPAQDVEECLEQYHTGEEIDFDEFLEKMGPIWKFAYYDVIGLPLQKQSWHMS